MKKIMFNDKYGLTRAVLEGRKTQTRRMLNPTMLFQRLKTYEGWSNEEVRAWKRSCNRRLYEAQGDTLQQMLDYALSHSHYKVGEEVAVAQAYKDIPSISDTNYVGVDWERATKNKPFGKWGCANKLSGWNNKMFVRADLMPHRIKITNIRIERLQDISDEDCIKEGVIYFDDVLGKGYMLDDEYNNNYRRHWYTKAKRAFVDLIEKSCGKDTWARNNYVYVYDFEIIK